MDFVNDIFSLQPPTNKKFKLIGTSLPTNKDIYFRAKQKEIIDQYAGARIFLRETDIDDWSHWFQQVEDKRNNDAFKLIFSSHFYEAALMYYNIIVDLSWTICYVSAEFAMTSKGTRVDFSGCKSIEDAYCLLRYAENSVTTPTAGTNPFGYLKSMCPEFETAIQMIIDFWNDFGSSEIRKKYNFCKHKGKPSYLEIEKLRAGKIFRLYKENQSTGEKLQMPSDIRDVQWQFSLVESINELVAFDDEKLFPYIKALLEELERVLQPSPMI